MSHSHKFFYGLAVAPRVVKLCARVTLSGLSACREHYQSYWKLKPKQSVWLLAVFFCRTLTMGSSERRAAPGFVIRRIARPQGWIPGSTCAILGTCRQGADFQEETGAHFHAQAHISTQPPQTREDSRFPRAYEDQERRSRVEPPPGHWPQACGCQRRLPRLVFPAGLF